MLANGQNSFNCSEESCNSPSADNYISLPDIYNLCSEEAENMGFKKGYIPWNKGEHSVHSGSFVKGMIPWNKGKKHISGMKGKKHTKESNEKNRQAHLGKIHSGCFKKGCIPFSKGKLLTEGTKKKMSDAKKGHPTLQETRRKISEQNKGRPSWNKGKHYVSSGSFKKGHAVPIEWKQKVSEACSGKIPKNPINKGEHRGQKTEFKKGNVPWCKGLVGEQSMAWKGGVSFIPYCHKFNKKLKEKIRERDNRMCQLCGDKENGRKLSVHHIHYDKENCEPDLISLCHHCNLVVNHSRDYYEGLFMELLKSRGIL